MRRQVLRILICLLIGAVLTIGVAWWQALYGGQNRATASAAQEGFVVAAYAPGVHERVVAMTVLVYRERTAVGVMVAGPMVSPDAPPFTRITTAQMGRSAIPGWALPIMTAQMRMDELEIVIESQDDAAVVAPDTLRLSAVGWPMVALWHGVIARSANQPQDRLAAPNWEPLPTSAIAKWARTWRLPVAPVWSGLIYNTVFYALVVWALMLLPRAARRALRRRAGKCERCGYIIHESLDMCSECGNPRSRPARDATPEPQT